MKVAFQGLPGAYSEAAVLEYFGKQTETLPCESFETVFAAVQDGSCEGGLLPIENSVAGSIHRNYDLLAADTSWLDRGRVLPARAALPDRLPGVRLDEVRSVISHPQALAQCDRYLHTLGVIILAGLRHRRQRQDRPGTRRAHPGSHRFTARRRAVRHEHPGRRHRRRSRQLHPFPGNCPRAGGQPTEMPRLRLFSPCAICRVRSSKRLSVFALRDIDLTKIESAASGGAAVGIPFLYRHRRVGMPILA